MNDYALTVEELIKLKKLLDGEPPPYSLYNYFKYTKRTEKSLEERIEDSKKMIKKWERSER